jgi:protein gp37
MRQARRFDFAGGPYEGLTRVRWPVLGNAAPDWSGVVRFAEHKLTEPLRWRKPQRVFVNSMSDLFHPKLAYRYIDQIFAVMALAPRHTFQILTKRPDRAARYFADPDREVRVGRAALPIADANGIDWDVHWRKSGLLRDAPRWPLDNVWLGTSAEDQATYDARITPLVHRVPAAVTWVSLEPLLGRIDLGATGGLHLDWVVLGGESGRGARDCDVAWIRDVVRQCAERGIARFVKQLGASPISADGFYRKITHPKGGDPREWPSDLRVRQWPRR